MLHNARQVRNDAPVSKRYRGVMINNSDRSRNSDRRINDLAGFRYQWLMKISVSFSIFDSGIRNQFQNLPYQSEVDSSCVRLRGIPGLKKILYQQDCLTLFLQKKVVWMTLPAATMAMMSNPHIAINRLGCLFLFDRNLFSGLKNSKKTDSWEFLFFPVFSGRFFHRNVVLEGVSGIPVFCRFHRIFLQEFLRDRNSCIYNGFLRISLDSSGLLFPPNAILLWPATKVGFLLSKYQLK